MEFVQDIYIKDFECKLYSNNGMSDIEGDKDLIYMSDIINNSIHTKDDIKATKSQHVKIQHIHPIKEPNSIASYHLM